ncbi:hypothetical protein Agub_g15013, partial [Astrephomene gubernaculifera]
EGPKRVAVPIVVMQDHTRDLEDERSSPSRWVDTDAVQMALDELLPAHVQGAVSVSRHLLSHHKELAAALVKARQSRSAAVLAQPPSSGLHRSLTSWLSPRALLREVRRALRDEELLAGLAPAVGEDYVAMLGEMEDVGEFIEGKRHETKVLPVFVFSLERAPDQLLLEGGQLAAAGPDVVAVLQLLGSPSLDDYSRGRVYSGHMSEGHHLLMDAGEAPTRAIIAGLATALGGVVPPQQRVCGAEGQVVEDWRWAVGAVPWGPYGNYTGISSIFAATVHRNLLLARIERPLRRLIASLERLDAFIATHLQGPFAFLHRKQPHPSASSSDTDSVSFSRMLPQHHLLDDLARQHLRYQNDSSPAALLRSLVAPAAALKARLTSAASSNTSSSPTSSPHEEAGGDHGEHYHSDGGEEGQQQKEGQQQQQQQGVEDLVADQQVLSPNVAQRLKESLDRIGEQLEQIGFLLYSRSWAELDDQLPLLAAAVDAFTAAVDSDLRTATEVLECCAVRHEPYGNSGMWFAVLVIVLALVGFGVAAGVAIRSQEV